MGRRKEKSDEQILRAARACFVRLGPNVATSLISRELGISQATLFNRFRTKKELMLGALTLDTENELLETLSRPPDDRPIREQLHEIGIQALRFFRCFDPNIEVLRASGLSTEEVHQSFGAAPILSCHNLLTTWINNANAAGQLTDTDARTLAIAYLGAIRNVAKADFIDDGGQPDVAETRAAELGPAEDRQFIGNLLDVFWPDLVPRGSTMPGLRDPHASLVPDV